MSPLSGAATAVLMHLLLGSASGIALHYVGSPARPNQTLYIQGSDLSTASARVCSARNGCTTLNSLQAWDGGIKATLPASLAQDIFNISACTPAGSCSQILQVNAPELQWWHSPSSETDGALVVGDTVSLLGVALAFADDGSCPPLSMAAARQGDFSTSVTLQAQDGSITPAQVSLASCYRVDVTIPPALARGTYTLWLNNGLDAAGSPGRIVASSVPVVLPVLWPTTLFTVGGACGNVTTCIAAANASGGGIVVLPAGVYAMPAGASLQLGGRVQLLGAGAAATQLLWAANTAAPSSPPISSASSGGPWQLRSLSVNITSVTGGQPAISVSNCIGCVVDGVTVTYDTSALPTNESTTGNPITVQSSSHWSVSNCNFEMRGTCNAAWPRNTGFWVQSCTDGALRSNAWISGCQGYSVDSSQRILLVDNTQTSVGNDSEGSGFNSFVEPQVLEHVYYGNNTQYGNMAAFYRWESMTFDAGGQLYFGYIASAAVNGSGQIVTLPANATQPGHNYAGMAFVVMGGTGLGQIRRIVAWDAFNWLLDAPFDTPLIANDSVVSLIGFRGNSIFDSNTYVNGTCFQYFGTALDVYAVGNTFNILNITVPNSGVNPAGMLATGLDYNGKQPVMFSHATDNTFLCGTQMASRSSGPPFPAANWTGPYGFGHVFRDNVLMGSTDWNVVGNTWDVLMENTTLGAAPCAPGQPPAGPGKGTVDPTSTMYVYVV